MRHNKKRNTGLLYEFLMRHAAERLVDGDDVNAKKCIKLVKRHFRRDSELFREFRLFHALVNSTVSDSVMAEKILDGARNAVSMYDVEKLDREKSLLIRGINHTLKDPKFYDQRVDEYRLYATTQQLFNEWRKNDSDIVRVAKYEKELVDWLMTKKKKNVLDEQHHESDALLLNILFKKIDGKYRDILSEEQIRLVNGYIYSMKNSDDVELKRLMTDVRASVIKALDEEIVRRDQTSESTKKMHAIKNMILNENDGPIDDDKLARHLRFIQLKREIMGE